MKNTKLTLLLAVLSGALFLVSCGGDETASSPAPSGYPLNVCVVSGEELGSMGEPFLVEYEGTTVKLCCDSCLPKFNADPAKFVAKLGQ